MPANDRFDVEGRVAVVTGASSGLGYAISEELAAGGAKVVMTSSNKQRLEDAEKLLKSSNPNADTDIRVMDVGERESIRETVESVVADYGKLDILVANAGITAGPGINSEIGIIQNVEDETWDKVVDVNLTGVFTSISAVAPQMIKQGSGRIVVVSSVASFRSVEMVGYAYGATKAGVVNIVQHAAMELAKHNINVNSIAPGPFATNISGGHLKDEAFASTVATMIPLGRVADVEEIKVARLLCSDASSFMTGQTIIVDGGLSAR